jgi:hypothetical protein
MTSLPDTRWKMTAADPVALAAEAYIALCLAVLRERCPAEGDTPMELGPRRWLEDTSGEGVITRVGNFKTFRLAPDVWGPARVCAQRELGRIAGEEVREYQELVEALESDPVVGGRLGDDVVGGAGLGGGPWQPQGIIDLLVLELVEQFEGFDPGPDGVERTIDRWLTYLRRPQEVVTVLAPLSDFVVDEPPLQVAEGVVLDELTSDEIGALLTVGPWTVSEFEPSLIFGGFPPSMMVQPVFAIRLSYAVPVVVRGGAPEQVEATLEAQAEAARVVEEVLLALRLFKQGRVGLRAIVYVIAQPLGQLWPSSGSRLGNLRRFRGDPYALPADEGVELTKFYRDFAAARSNRLIETASRRFGYAADRNRPDDEIVDLFIAAESLFLGEGGPPAGELTFRLSTRAALFADGGADERRRVLTFVRKAYRTRSGIVHSGKLDESKLRTLQGDAATVAEFADDLEGVLRLALRKAVRLVASGMVFPPEWDDLLFPPDASREAQFSLASRSHIGGARRSLGRVVRRTMRLIARLAMVKTGRDSDAI